MPETNLSDLLARLKAANAITADDALAVRRIVFCGDCTVSPQEAEALIALDEAADARCPEWDMLFVEALTDFLVRQQEPAGYVDERGAAWLIDAVSRDGKVKSDSELDAVIHVLETAEVVPPRLTAFALEQIKAAVLADGVIGADEVKLLRRVLYAAGGDGNIAITRPEAELLFDINDAVRDATNDPSWTDLFVKAVAASVMTVSGYQPVPREEAARLNAWLTAPSEGVGSFLGKMFKSAASGGGFGHRGLKVEDPLADWKASNAVEDAAYAAAEPIDQGEADWLVARIGRDGTRDTNEQALIDFLRRESPTIHPDLQTVIAA